MKKNSNYHYFLAKKPAISYSPQKKYVNIHSWIFEYDEEVEYLMVEGEERCLLKKYI